MSVIMIGGTGAVGGEVVRHLLARDDAPALTLLGRRAVEGIPGLDDGALRQHLVDVLDPASYAAHVPGHDVAICTLGVGQPSKLDRETFERIDKRAVLDFATACREAGVRHFELLGSLGASVSARSYYLRVKGELEAGLEALGFERLSLFRPSMILTPENRYGVLQGLTLAVWPRLDPLLVGPLQRLRGIPVAHLGKAIAANTRTAGEGVEVLHWRDIEALSA